MYSGLIHKIEKARRYAQEPHRATILQFTANFHGEHDDHTVSLKDNTWNCTCSFFAGHDRCSHTMALQQILAELITVEGAVPR